MKTIWDYKIMFPYGYSSQYYGGTRFHNGEDWTITDGRKDIPVTVNGVTIGITGTTGNSTGLHTHVSKFIGGLSQPPRGGGKTLSNAKVIYVDTVGSTGAGKFVRVQSGIYSWVYLHLSSVKVKVGQVLKQEEDVIIDLPTARYLVATAYGYDGQQGRLDAFKGQYDKQLKAGLVGKKLNHDQIVTLFRAEKAKAFRASKG